MRRTNPSELLVRQRLGAVTRLLPAARQGDVESLHQARVATRRLREALPLVSSGNRQRKLERTVRALTRALGPVRELDVALLMLGEFEAAGDLPRTAITRLRQDVTAERRRLHVEMTRRLERCDLDKLRKRAVTSARKAGSSTSVRDPKQAAAARVRAALRAETLMAAIDNAAGIYLPDRLHEVRIAVKKLRYALEVVATFTRSRAEARLRVLKKVQDLLGRMHDLEILIARTRGVQGAPSAPTLRLSADLDRLVRRLENECRQLHSQYMTSRPALLTICDRVAAVAARHRDTAA